MSAMDERVPALSEDVSVSVKDREGHYVVKHSKLRTYFRIGEQESFLLARFDGKATFGSVAASFEAYFGDTITGDEIKDFAALAKSQGLVRSRSRGKGPSQDESPPKKQESFFERCKKQAASQSLLYFRVSLFDPNKSLNWLEPRTRWLFSVETAILAIVMGVVAMYITWANWHVLIGQIQSLWQWQTLVVAWTTIIAVSIAHEYGHGLACKKYGGEVREMGVLWIFFTPCFFCNVSDAWLLPSRRKRLIISMAGTYVDFWIWIVAVFVWRVASPNTWISVAMWLIVTSCGIRVAFNLNPLMRLDGYYALADALGVHNLRRRGRDRLMEFARWVLWGADRPHRIPDGNVLLIYGLVNWMFVISIMSLLTFSLSSTLQPLMGIGGVMAAGSFFVLVANRYFKGSLGEDFRTMFKSRKLRILIWPAVIGGVAMIPITDRAGGEFFVRPIIHSEVRAPVAGFLRKVSAKESESISAGKVLAVLEVPELQSEITRKELEIAETEATLRLLRCGTRPEVLAEQTEKIARATSWRELAKHDLELARQSLASEISAFKFRVERANTDLSYRTTIVGQARQLYEKGGLAGQQLLSLQRQVKESESELKQIESEKQARAAAGVLTYEAELARREKDLADVIAEKTIMDAGSRPEEIEAKEAQLRRLNEEIKHLRVLDKKQIVTCPVDGTVTTPRIHEKIGQFLQRGDPICTIEDLRHMEAEIAVSEHDAYILEPGQPVSLRPRSLPFRSITGRVERIAPATQTAVAGQTATGAPTRQARLAVYCRVDNDEGILRTGMTGFGRVYSEKKCLGWYLVNKALRLLRTEFWW